MRMTFRKMILQILLGNSICSLQQTQVHVSAQLDHRNYVRKYKAENCNQKEKQIVSQQLPLQLQKTIYGNTSASATQRTTSTHTSKKYMMIFTINSRHSVMMFTVLDNSICCLFWNPNLIQHVLALPTKGKLIYCKK